jgi:hypothetical protein
MDRIALHLSEEAKLTIFCCFPADPIGGEAPFPTADELSSPLRLKDETK